MVIWEVDDGDQQKIEGLDEDGRPDPAYAAALGLVPAPLGRRSVAFLIDFAVYLVLQAPYLIFAAPLLLMLFTARISWYGFLNHPQFILAVVMAGVTTLLTLAFCIVQLALHGRKGTTLGKAVMGIRSVNVRTLEKPGIRRVLLRSLVLWGSAVVVVGPILFLISPLFDPQQRGRGWLDMVGRTWFVDIREGLQPYDDKRMRIARKTVKAEPVARPRAMPSLATSNDGGGQEPYRPGARVSAGVLGVARPHGAGPRPVVGLGQETVDDAPEAPPTPGRPAAGAYRPADQARKDARTARPSTTASAPSPGSAAIAGAPPPSPPSAGVGAPAGSHTLVTGLPGAPSPSAPPSGASAEPVGASRHGDPDDVEQTSLRGPDGFVLQLDSGERVAITETHVLGRNPAVPDSVRGARRMPVADDTRSVSKTHLAVRPVERGIEVIDQHSTNGTSVVHDGAERPLAAGQPGLALPGDTIRFGDRTAVVARA
ncbi:hypothetical protein GCM10023169_31700 [Georgenia halophila]|uniref:FHA domain-containing protein n=1 Tax=Georgenia halophila TaxID=620889 RepID=A0ABP8LI10_9MICO